MTSPASRRAALLARLGELVAAYREMAGLALPAADSDAAAGAWLAACEAIMARADAASAAYAIECAEYARALGAPAFTFEAVAPLDRDLADRVAALTAEASETLRLQAARLAGVRGALASVRERMLGEAGRLANGRRVRAAYAAPSPAGPVLFDRKE